MENKKLLITRPCYDDTTSYLHKWSEKIIELARKRNLTVFDLSKERVNKEELKKFIENQQPKFLIFNGHGSDDEILGHNGSTLIKSGENHNLLKSKITYAISCRSARKLGPDSIEVGATAYIGYKEDFIFAVDKNKATVPLFDNLAKPFFEASNIIPFSLIKGNTVSEAYQKSQETFQKFIDYFKAHYTLESLHIMLLLRWDMIAQAALGDMNATF